ncbi:MAG: hypothetical protein KC492_19150 [Myxococcales bacterium]|nr:hypothetical protein [Myxococcales bacterium]
MVSKVIRISLFGLGGALVLLSAIFLASDSGVDRTIEHSRQIEASFKSAHTFVEGWQSEHERLPTTSEFEVWSQSQPDHVYGPRGIRFSTGAFPDEVLEAFGEAPANAYLLSFWRGEWEEYDPSWSTTSSLIFEKSRYFFLDSAAADSTSVAGIGVLVLLLARAVGRRAA